MVQLSSKAWLVSLLGFVLISETMCSVSPKLVIPAPVVQVLIGTKLSCSATGTPPIYIAIIKYSTTLLNTTHSASIPVTEGGNYTCRATSKYGTDEKEVVFVNVSPKLVIPAPVVQVFRGTKLSCSATGTPPIYIAIYSNSTILVNATHSATIRVYERGNYTCRATSKYGTDEREVVIINVPQVKQSSPSRFAKPVGEEEVKLVCQVKEAQAYTWYKNGKKITSTVPRYTVKPYRFLRITNVLKSDSGLFVCVTSNLYGSANCTINFMVEEKPQFLYPDVMRSVKSEYKIGDKFSLTCEAKGKPSPVVTWYKNGKIYYGGSNTRISAGRYDYKVIFSAVDLGDRGSYMCNVSNAFGFLTYSYKFTVEDIIRSPPQAYRIWEQDKPIYVGQDVELFCTILTKDRNTKYRWYYSNAEFPSEQHLGVLIDPRLYKQPLYNGDSRNVGNVKFTLMLKNLTIDESGHYACQAENILGNESRLTSLNVTYRFIIPVTTDPEDRKSSQDHRDTSSISAATLEPKVTGKKRSWTSRIKYPWVLVGVAVIIASIILLVWFCWKLKKTRTYARNPLPGITSLQPKYEVKNEYVALSRV